MSREDKINEGQVLLHDINSYRSLDKPMVETTAKKVNQLIKSLHQGNHIDEMTGKWPSLTPNPPRIPVFYTLSKIHKPTPVGRPIISKCDGLQSSYRHVLTDSFSLWHKNTIRI